jgi:hypothetical protein
MLHPALLRYEALSSNDKQKDRNTVLALVGILGQQGLIITRANSMSGPGN